MINFGKTEFGYLIICTITAASVITLLFLSPIGQDQAYHLFADTRNCLEIPNCLNVLSNLPLLLVGLLGMRWSITAHHSSPFKQLQPLYLLLFSGALLTALGSGYYHLNPTNSTLFWDRLPMTITFMSFFAILLGEFCSIQLGRKSLVPLLVLGIYSVVYWHFTEMGGEGDLRLYALVQFLPALLLPVFLLFLNSEHGYVRGYWLLALFYCLAKIAEYYDLWLYQLPYIISGHTLKHLFVACGLWCLLESYRAAGRVTKNI